MKSDQWKRLDEILGQALELPREDRQAFMEEACGDDKALLSEALSLLQADGEASEFLAESEVKEESASREGESVGAYQLLEVLGSGGMGTVYRARRSDGAFEKEVALKLLKPGVGSELWRRRFRTERHILGRLEHPHIATLLDGGNTETGEPFLVMELVEGRSIDQYCREEKLSVKERIVLLEKVCGAVAFAHQNLVVHRDLKPGNVLVNEEGEPRLLDFGIAKLLEPEMLEVTVEATQTHVRPMSPSYASPEQISGGAITTATDVWTLGTLTYELLTGTRPYETSSSLAEMEADRQTAPQAPSVVTGEARERRQIKGDLDTIVLKALRADPERRYGTAADLGADFRRHLEGLPVQARPDSLGYRVGKFVGRHRLPVGLGAVSLAVIVGLLIGLFFQAEDLRGERDKARQTVDLLVEVLGEASAQQNPGEEVTVREAMELGEPVMREKLKDQPELLGVVVATIGNVYLEMSRFDEARSRLSDAVQLLGDKSPRDSAAALKQLGILGLLTGDFIEGERFLEQSLAALKELEGENSIRAASVKQWLGVIRFENGERERSFQDMGAVNDLLDRIDPPRFGSEKLEYFQAKFYAQAYLGRYHNFNAAINPERTRYHFDEALRIAEEGFPENSVDRAAAYSYIAFYLESIGDIPGAVELYRKAFLGMKKIYRKGHSETAKIQYMLGRNLRKLGSYEEAIKHGRESQQVAVKLYEPGNIELSRATSDLVVALAETGQWHEVVELMETPAGGAILNNQDHLHRYSSHALVQAYLGLGDISSAEKVLERVDLGEGKTSKGNAMVILAQAELAEAKGEIEEIRELVVRAKASWPAAPVPQRFRHHLPQNVSWDHSGSSYNPN